MGWAACGPPPMGQPTTHAQHAPAAMKPPSTPLAKLEGSLHRISHGRANVNSAAVPSVIGRIKLASPFPRFSLERRGR